MKKRRSIIKRTVRKTLAFLDHAIAFLIFYSGFAYVFSRIYARNRITIVFYHEIGNNRRLLGKTAVSEGTFEKQIRYMNGLYNAVSLNDLHSHFEGKKRIPCYPLAVTFDGGYAGNYTHAYPVLKKCRMPATIYLVTSYLESQEMPWQLRLLYIIRNSARNSLPVALPGLERTYELADRLDRISCAYDLARHLTAVEPQERKTIIDDIARQLDVAIDAIPSKLFLTTEAMGFLAADDLIDFGSHTLTHPNLSGMPDGQAAREISESKSRIEKLTGREVTSFCYPHGHFSDDTKTLVSRAGYHSATTTVYGLNTDRADRYELKRIAIQDVPLYIFATELCGLYRSGTIMRLLDRIKRSGDRPENGYDVE